MTRTFWKDLLERAVKTFAQTLLATLGVSAVDVLHVNWVTDLSFAAGAALLSVLSSLVSLPVGGNGTASLISAVRRRHGRHEAFRPTP